MEKVIRHFLKSLLGRMLYLEEDAYLIEWDRRRDMVSCRKLSAPLEAHALKKCFVIVLGKETYYETAKTFPITSVPDIKEAALLEGGETCPFPYGQVFVRAVKLSDSQSLVNLWYIKEKAMTWIEKLKPYVLIPETALLGIIEPKDPARPVAPGVAHEDEKGKLVAVHKGERVMFCLVDDKGITASYQCGAQDIDSARAHFKRMVGHKAGGARNLSFSFPGAYLEAAHDAFWRLGAKSLLTFRYHNPLRLHSAYKDFLLRGAAIACSLVLLYFLIFSFVLLRTKNRLVEVYDQKKEASVQYTQMEEEIRKKFEAYNAVKSKIEAYRSKVALYNMVNDALPDGTVLLSLHVVDRDVEIRGVTPRATDVLSTLSAVPGVQSPRFVSAVTKADSKENSETFAIGFRQE
jgi:hypothetical protein